MSYNRFSRHRVMTPSDLGFNAVALDAAKTSNFIDMHGCSSLTFYVDYTRSAGTAMVFDLTLSPDDGSSAAEYVPLTEAVTAGAATLSAYESTYTIATTKKFVVPFFALNKINASQARLKITCTNGAAGDLVTVKCLATYSA